MALGKASVRKQQREKLRRDRLPAVKNAFNEGSTLVMSSCSVKVQVRSKLQFAREYLKESQ